MADKVDVDQMRETFQRVIAYRAVCEAVRGTAGRTMFSGVFFLGLTALLFSVFGLEPIFLAYAAIGFGEILVGVWKKVSPSAEGVLADALFHFAFATAIGVRQLLIVQAGGNPHPISLFIAAWVLFDGIRTFQQYTALRRMFVDRPSREHIAYVDELIAEIRDSDPEIDQQALDLPTAPHLKAKLLGDLAIFVEPRSGGAIATSRDDVEIEREESADGLSNGILRIDGEEYPEFVLSPANWRNYARWKTEGGHPPPPVKVRPVREQPSDD
jgi:hypothetical protein